MRVIESETVTKGVSMGKKKHKLKKQIRENSNFPDDSSDDSNAGQSCIHVTKALNFSVVKKSLKQSATLGVCSSCEHDKSVRSKQQQDKSCCTASGEELFPGESGVDEDELSYGAVWLCLQCGNQGCDRNSSAQHALKHYKTPHSNSHTLCVNLLSWSVWCYTCDGEVNLKKQKRLVECVDFIHKLSDQQTTGPRPVSSLPTDTNTPTSTTYVASNTPTTTNTEKPEKINLFKARSSSVLAAMPKVKGLSNLGNTCFFNAVMQILSQTSVLESVLSEQSKKGISLSLNSAQLCDSDVSASDSSCEELDKKYIDLDPLTITLPETGLLTQSVLTFLREMNSSSKNGTVSPSALFRQICNKAPRFKGYHEQDSHELLRHLLDGMKAEEIKRSRGGILKSFNLTENTNPKNVNDDIRSKLKAYAKQARHTFVDSIFGGYFISTVQCEDCHYPSQIFEPFQDISLPITEEKPLRPSTLFSAKKQHENSLDSLYQGKSHVDDTTSKHQQKKARKLAKKDSKKRLRAANANSNKVSPLSESVETSGSNEMLVADADVEDNLDSDASRVARATNVSLPSTTAAASAVGVTAPATTYADIGPSLGMAPICDISETERITDTSASSNSSVSSTANDLDVTDTHGSSNNNTAAALQTLTSDDRKDSGIDSVADSLSMLSVNGRDSMKSNMSSCGSSSNSGSTNNVALATTNDSTSIHHAGLQHNTVTNSKHKLSTDHIELHKPLSTSASLIQEERLHAKMKAMLTLSNKKHSTLHECSVMSCLNQFTAPELLTGNNKFGCTKCTNSKYGKQSKENKKRVYTNASKQVLVFSPPAVLTLHLKRFQQVGLSLRKVNRHVDFPLVLDLAPYCSALCQRVKFNQHQVLYSLYGVVEHSGRLTSGHYTAYVKVRPNTPNPTVNPATDKLLAFLQRHDQPHAVKLQKIYAQQQQETHKVQNTTAQHPSYPTSNHSNTNNNTTAAAATDESAASKEPSVTVAPGKWYHISDSNVSDSTEATVLKCQAYMLFYERVM